MNDALQNSAANSDEVGAMNIFQRIIGVFVSPGKTFEYIAKKPDWLAPLIVVLLITLVFTNLTMSLILETQKDAQQKALVEQGYSDTEIENAMEMSAKMAPIFANVGAIFGVVIFILVVSALLLLLGNVVFGGSATFKQLFAISSYAWLIPAVGSLIKLPLILSKNTIDVHFSLATFFPPEQAETFTYQIFKAAELFTIWQFVVLAIGLGIAAKISKEKAGLAVGILFVLFVLFTAWMFSLVS